MNRGIYRTAPDIVRVRKAKSPESWWLPWMVTVRIGRSWYHADEANNWYQAMAIARQIVRARRNAVPDHHHRPASRHTGGTCGMRHRRRKPTFFERLLAFLRRKKTP